MSAKRISRSTASADRMDWKRVRAMKDADIAYDRDAPRTKQSDWADAIAHRGLPVPPRKQQIALRVDEDVLGWFRAQGRGWQTRMNAVLKAYKQSHATASRGRS